MRRLLEAYGLRCCRVCDMPTGRPRKGRPRDFCPLHNSSNDRKKWSVLQVRRSLAVTCATCQQGFEPVKVGQTYCSNACRVRAHLDRQTVARPHHRRCVECGSVLGVLYKKLCAPCKEQAQRAVDARRNQKRRAAGPPIDRTALIRERGDKCHLCGKRIDLRLSGLHPMGLNIEHLVPVSDGGTNDLDNLHIAHRKCNVMRGNQGPAQLLIPNAETQ